MASRSPFRPMHLAALALVSACALPAAAAAQDFRWTGGAALGDQQWSHGANWAGGVPPSGSVGTLQFPKLDGCPLTQQSKSCYSSDNDISGLTATSMSLENTQGYFLAGNALTLGSGGLKAAPETNQCPCNPTLALLPIVLGADQTWSIDGSFGLTVDGTVTGPHALHIDVGSSSNAYFKDVEVGPVTMSATGGSRSGFAFFVLMGSPSHPSELNGVDGQPVHVSGGILLRASRAVVGSLSTDNAVVSGAGSSPPGKLDVNGGVTLDSRSELLGYVAHSGASAGKDYWQLAASGPVDLAGASLVLSVSTSKGYGPDQRCPKLKRGTVETLIKTKASLKGKFHGIRNKHKVRITCSGKRPTLRIRYKKHAVTAKVV
ncbi:MAG: hypothetical protein QOD53_1098 [Thermoleophilaceae bacterium]|nr:hypothetical protein [Thermoleophilaceae bacterium]